MVQVENQTRNKMNTYYIKHDNGAFAEVTFSNEMLISMVIEKYLKDAIFTSTEIINAAINRKVDKVCDELNIQGKIKEHLSAMELHELVNECVKDAVAEYNYDGVIDNVLDNVDIDEMVTEKVQDHLDSCSIQVRIN